MNFDEFTIDYYQDIIELSKKIFKFYRERESFMVKKHEIAIIFSLLQES